MKELMGEAKVEAKEVLLDLLDVYNVNIIPSSDQQLIVNYLKLKGQQALRNILRDLGWAPALHRIDGKQKRVWIRQGILIENGRVDAPHLSKDLNGAVELGFTWWSLTKEISLGWDSLCSEVLRPGRFVKKTSDKGKTTIHYELHSKPQEDYSRGPFPDSTSDVDYESYLFLKNRQDDEQDGSDDMDLEF